MNALERRATAGLSMVYALRMLGMFMVLPVFSLYAHELPGGVTPLQIGLAIGIYGLAQAALQVPLGTLSDRIGRKPVIIGGMLVFALGSVVAGLAESIEWVIAGRAIQGSGAVASAVTALLADTTRLSVRTRAMTTLGIGMGVAFGVALVLGPILSGWLGVGGIFLMTAGLALLTVPLVLFYVPPEPEDATLMTGRMRDVLADPDLLRLNGGIFLLHALLTSVFVAVPFALRDTLGLEVPRHWLVYLPVLMVSALCVFPVIRWSERSGAASHVFLCAIGLLFCALSLAAAGAGEPAALVASLVLFFIAFNYLEGFLPSQVSRLAPSGQKGAALGSFTTSQFLGSFAGGALGGWALGAGGVEMAFAVGALLPLGWLGFAHKLRLAPGDQPENQKGY